MAEASGAAKSTQLVLVCLEQLPWLQQPPRQRLCKGLRPAGEQFQRWRAHTSGSWCFFLCWWSPRPPCKAFSEPSGTMCCGRAASPRWTQRGVWMLPASSRKPQAVHGL